MSTKRFDTLDDLARHRRTMDVKCLQCGHTAELTPWFLTQYVQYRPGKKLGTFNQSLGVIADRLRCSECGARKVDWFPRSRD